MPFSDAERLLRDIVDAIGMIESFTAGMDLEEFRDDPKTVAAVERKLQQRYCNENSLLDPSSTTASDNATLCHLPA